MNQLGCFSARIRLCDAEPGLEGASGSGSVGLCGVPELKRLREGVRSRKVRQVYVTIKAFIYLRYATVAQVNEKGVE